MILIWHDKHGDVAVYARSPEEKEAAYFYLFWQMDNAGYYDPCVMNTDVRNWYEIVKDSSKTWQKRIQMAHHLLQYRSDRGYEYENISEIIPVTP